ncbi:hypothetical protein O181_054987 [Austropuccinia psidii MF-1]|uniref:Integrase catalytic domain-containing protein n=1 Tax=Austropuccinia psidii MF-1 TaxID=1389203 RepID=A0A9Q3E7Z1_9BASI|nr:hypothetical protein [Austropuccinia psidii MF-1]
MPSHATAKEFFDTVKARCCPVNRFQKLKVVCDLLGTLIENGSATPKPNNTIVLTLRRSFSHFKKLGIKDKKLEGLLAQAACHAPPTLDQAAFDQLITAAILSKGKEKPSLTFVGQVILNVSQTRPEAVRLMSPFVYRMSDPPESASVYPRLKSPSHGWQVTSASDVHLPPDHLIERFGVTCFHCGQADCPHTSSIANPNRRPPSLATFGSTRPITPDRRPHTITGRECPRYCSIPHFFADTNSSITISQMTTLKIPIQGGHIIICNVPFSKKISGTILSIGRLCRAGFVPLFSKLKLSLLVNHFVVATTFVNNCWWLDIVQNEGTNVSAAVTPSSCLIEMNPISPSSSKSVSSRKWHERLGHACDKVVISFLKQHVPTFNTKQWQPFFCEVCTRAKRTHRLARAHTDIMKEKPLDLLALDIMGPFDTNALGFCYILTVWDHVSTYSIVYPLKSRSEAPQAIIDCSFVPLLPYSPQENWEAESLNQTLGDMARAMMTQSGMPTRFWHYAYASACYIHNHIPNSHCANSLPYQELFGQALAIATIYPFGAEAIVHLPANQQPHKLVPRGVPCKLLKPLMTGGGCCGTCIPTS